MQEATHTQRSRSVSRNAGMTVLGVPIVAFITSIISALMYFIVEVVMVSTDCPFRRTTIEYFIAVFAALVSTVAMLNYHIFYRRAKPDCFSLLLSLLYAGSACVVLFLIIHTAMIGFCVPIPAPPVHVSNAPAYPIWFLSSTGVICQLIGHFFFA